MRESRREPLFVKQLYQTITTYTCDSCGKKMEEDDHDNPHHEIEMTLDQEECVNFYRRRDYCDECMVPVWDAMNKLIGTDPDLERDRDYG